MFRDRLSSAAAALTDGQWLALYDGANQIVGHGIYEAEGAIGIRVVSRGPARPDAALFAGRIDAALVARAELRAETDAFRAIHGESDGLPAVVVDVFGAGAAAAAGGVVVVQTYSAGTDALGRFAAAKVAGAVGAGCNRRQAGAAPGRRHAARRRRPGRCAARRPRRSRSARAT